MNKAFFIMYMMGVNMLLRIFAMSDKKVDSAVPGFVVGTLLGALIFPASLIGVVATAVIGGAVFANIEDK